MSAASPAETSVIRGITDAASPLDADWQTLDALESYNLAVREIGRRVKAGAPVPEFFREAAP